MLRLGTGCGVWQMGRQVLLGQQGLTPVGGVHSHFAEVAQGRAVLPHLLLHALVEDGLWRPASENRNSDLTI